MSDRPLPEGADAGELEQSLAAARTRRRELAAELERLDGTIATLERRLFAGAPSRPTATPPPGRAASAWERAVQSMRRKPAPVEDRLPPSAGAPARAAAPAALPRTPPTPRAADEPPVPLEDSPPRAAPVEPARAQEPPPIRLPPTPSPAARPAPARTGPSFLHALEADGRLAPHQREALRGVYLRFAPAPPPLTEDTPRIPADEALDLDPALGRGQREAIRTLLDRFLRKTSR